jgi:predicted amidohydrolase
MPTLSIAAIQTVPRRGDVIANVAVHERAMEIASARGADVAVFPELSITGYEMDLAEALAFVPEEDRLRSLREAVRRLGIVAVVGVPLRLSTGLPYTKRHVHESEAGHFVCGDVDPRFDIAGEVAALAICADTSHAVHAAHAAGTGASLYLAGSFITPEGYARDDANLRTYATEHSLVVAMANYGGSSGGMESGGRSAVWAPGGRLLARAPESGGAIVLARRESNGWTATVLETDL